MEFDNSLSEASVAPCTITAAGERFLEVRQAAIKTWDTNADDLLEQTIEYLRLWPQADITARKNDLDSEIYEGLYSASNATGLRLFRLISDRYKQADIAQQLVLLHMNRALSLKAENREVNLNSDCIHEARRRIEYLRDHYIDEDHYSRACALIYKYHFIFGNEILPSELGELYTKGYKAVPNLKTEENFLTPIDLPSNINYNNLDTKLKEHCSRTFSLYEVIINDLAKAKLKGKDHIFNLVQTAINKIIPGSSLVLTPVKGALNYYRNDYKKTKYEDNFFEYIQNPQARNNLINALAYAIPRRYTDHLKFLTEQDINLMAQGAIELMVKYLIRGHYNPNIYSLEIQIRHQHDPSLVFLEGLVHPKNALKNWKDAGDIKDIEKVRGLRLVTLYPDNNQFRHWNVVGLYKNTWIKTPNGELYINTDRLDRKYGDRYDDSPADNPLLKNVYKLHTDARACDPNPLEFDHEEEAITEDTLLNPVRDGQLKPLKGWQRLLGTVAHPFKKPRKDEERDN